MRILQLPGRSGISQSVPHSSIFSLLGLAVEAEAGLVEVSILVLEEVVPVLSQV